MRRGRVRLATGLPRPLLAAALAVVAGGALAAGVPDLSAEAWRRAALATLVGALLVLVRGRSGPRTRLAAIALLLVALAGARARADADRPASREGRFEPVWAAGGTVRARLAPGRLEVDVAEGLVAPGELVRIVGGRAPSPLARGPVPPPPLRGAAHVLQLLPDELVRLAPRARGPRADVDAWVAGLRARLIRNLGTIEDPAARGLAAALVFGDLGAMPEEIPDLFVRTGTFHALAISGVQVALIAALLLGPVAALVARTLRALGTRGSRWAGEAVRAALLALYVPLAGAGPPVVRAALCGALAFVAPLAPARGRARVRARGAEAIARLGRRPDGVSLWSLALLLECALHPDAPSELSVQLSYAATLGLIVGTGPLRRRLRPPLPAAADALGRPRSLLLRALAARAGLAAAGGLAASIAAVLATLPIVWTRLGEWSPLGVIATLAIALPTTILLLAGWCAALVPGAVPEIVLSLPSHAMLATLRGLDGFPGTPEPLPPRPAWLLAACALLAFAAWTLRSERAARACGRVAALLGALILVPWTTAPRRFELWALEVGGGTCCVVRAPGLGTWVFDAGSRNRRQVARAALAPLLRGFDLGTLGVVLSHPDRDHDLALPWLVARWPPAAYAGALPAHVAARLPHTVPRIDLARGRAGLPPLQGACTGPVAWLERGLDVPGNEGSRTLRLAWFGEEVVLCGDAEAEGLRAWLDLEPLPRPVRLLLAPHHGSETELLAPLLAATDPCEVWISGGARPAIGAELSRRGLPWRSTGRDGVLWMALEPPAGWNGACRPIDPP